MDLGLRGKRVLVTGASGNIGRATAIVFGMEGARIAAGYHSNETGAQRTADLVAEAGGEPMTVPIDLAGPSSIERAAQQVKATFGGIDVLVNNAVAWSGFPDPGELFETAPAQRMRTSLEANLLGSYLMTRAAAGSMRERGWGRVVHVSTGLVQDGRAGSAAYVTAKAGLHGLTRTMSRELAAAGILTNLVRAGFVPGERQLPPVVLQQAAAAAATGRTTSAAEVANLIAFLCSRANTSITGELIRADGHFLTPR